MCTAGAKNFCAVSGLTGLHYSSISFPMPGLKTRRNNQVERMAERFRLGISKNSLRGPIPQEYESVRSCRDDCIARRLYKSFKIKWPACHGYLRFVPHQDRKTVGFFKAFVSQPADIEGGLRTCLKNQFGLISRLAPSVKQPQLDTGSPLYYAKKLHNNFLQRGTVWKG